MGHPAGQRSYRLHSLSLLQALLRQVRRALGRHALGDVVDHEVGGGVAMVQERNRRHLDLHLGPIEPAK